jgi:hypothetical protein
MGVTQQRADLELLRAGLLAAFESADDAVKAQIAGQLRATIKDLAGLAEPTEASVADELRRRRENRVAGTGDNSPAAKRGQSRRRGGDNRTG